MKKKKDNQRGGGGFAIEAFITWEDGTKSTFTAKDYGELFLQINSVQKEMISMDSHLIEEEAKT